MQARWLSSWLPPVRHLVAVAVVSALAALCGVELTRQLGNLSAIWFTDAILVAVLLTRPPRHWPALIAAGLAADMMTGHLLGRPLAPLIAMEGTNCLEILLAAGPLRRLRGQAPDLSMPGGLLAFTLIGVVLAPVCAALLGSQVLTPVWGSVALNVFLHRYLGGALGIAVLTPLVLAVLRRDIATLLAPPAVLCTFGVVAAYLLVLGGVFAQDRFPLMFLPFPVLLFAVRRLGFAGASLLMPLTAGIAFGATHYGHGPLMLLPDETPELRMTIVQLFVAVTCATAYLVGLGVAERRRLSKALADKHFDLAASEQLYRLLADNSSDIIVRSSENTRVYVSPSAQEVLGWTPEEMMRPDWKSKVHPDDFTSFLSLRDRLAEGTTNSSATYRYQRKDGSWAWLEGRAHIVHQSPDGQMEFVANIRDVTRQKEAELALETVMAELAMQAATDPLTGIANRRCFEENLEKEWRRGMRIADPLSLLLIDVDHFKSFNDLYGHQAGDECLRFVASTIASSIRRAHDVVARYGGEEFIVMLPATTVDGAERIAESIRARVADRAVPHAAGAGGVLAVSIGVACIAPHADNTPSALIEAADAALYAAKRTGRNRVIVAGTGKDEPIGGEAAVA